MRSSCSDDIKFVSSNSVFKGVDCSELGNYQTTSTLSYFSKILEHITYNCFYMYILENKIPYSKKFDFRVGHSANHTIIKPFDHIS